MKRRLFMQTVAAGMAGTVFAAPPAFKLRYALSSALYGELPLDVILPEVTRAGCDVIDIWCKVHGNQREQIQEMGDEAFRDLLREHGTKLGVSTRYPLGPFGLADELRWVKSCGGALIVTGSSGPKDPVGVEAKAAVQTFLEKMKPHVELAESLGVTIAIENHAGQLLYHPDALRYFVELNRSRNLGIAFAPHHLHRWQAEIPHLIRDLGAEQLPFIYFQEHSEGMFKATSKEVEMQQLPGFGGTLDYSSLLRALRDIQFAGFVEIFMHPTPRGVPILPTVAEITAAINKSRRYIEQKLAELD